MTDNYTHTFEGAKIPLFDGGFTYANVTMEIDLEVITTKDVDQFDNDFELAEVTLEKFKPIKIEFIDIEDGYMEIDYSVLNSTLEALAEKFASDVEADGGEYYR